MPKEILYGLIGLIAGATISGLVVFNQTKGASTNQPVSTQEHSTVTHDSSMSMDDMMKALEGKTGDEFDKAFIEQMIPHHQGAIDMAELALKNAEHQEIKDLAQEIIKAQETEINMMRGWQSSWGY
jgi:uncharacterized protein (DUF305 family)